MKNINSKEDFANIANSIIGKYIASDISPSLIEEIRDELYNPIMECKEKNIDIHDLFPFTFDCGCKTIVKLYQNGEVYIHGITHISYLYKSYDSESICKGS